jgi:hypothetical protein
MHRTLALASIACALAGAAAAQPSGGAVTPAAGIPPPTPVEETALARDAFSTGVLVKGDGALDPGLWKRADPVRVGWLLDASPARLATPSLGEALRRTLLSPGDAPQGASPSLGGRKLLALARAGFGDEARTIASLSNAPRNDPWVGQALATADLLDGLPNEACRRNQALASGRDAVFWVKLRVLCYAIAGQSDAADLSLTLLREQGFLSDVDEAFLAALASGAPLKAPQPPQNALHLAAARQLGMPLSAALLVTADGGVLKAISRDPSIGSSTRVDAAMRAAAMGVISPSALRALFESFDIAESELARAEELARSAPDDPMTDVLVYQAIRTLAAPEFLRDKASRIAAALARADSFPRAYAASLLYAEEITAMEGALLQPNEAGRFALARMAQGDGDGAARWLFSMAGSGSAASLAEDDALDMIDLTNLLAILDPISAKAVAEAAKITLDGRSGRVAGEMGRAEDQDAIARIVESAFDAAVDEAPGQAALAAIAASAVLNPADPLGRVVVSQSLRAAGLNELRRRMDFEAAWRARFAATAPRAAPPAPPGPAVVAPQPVSAPAPPADRGPVPRLKPKRAGQG